MRKKDTLLAIAALGGFTFSLAFTNVAVQAETYHLQDDAVTSPSDAATVDAVISDAVDAVVEDPGLPLVDEDTSVADMGKKCGGKSSKCGGFGFSCEQPPWKIRQPSILQRHGIMVGGWIQQGVTLNNHSPADGFNGPVATNDMANQYQLNQAWLYLIKPVNTGGSGWDIGGRIDMMYGSDWRFGVNNGLEDNINGLDNQDYGMVLPQAYLEVAYNNLSVKLGHFAAILDYEAVPAVVNPFYSHSYSYGYTVPQLVTGVLADLKLTDQFSLQAGTHRGWSQFEDNNGNWDIMGGVKWTSCDQSRSVAFALSSGRQGVPFNDQNRYVQSLVVQQQMTERLKYVLVQNLGIENDAAPLGDAEWYGLNQYFLFTLNPCLSANLRVEWLRDDDGARIAGPGNVPGIDAWSGRGYAGNFYELTAGLNWRPHSNIIVRPEARWDWYNGRAGVPAQPFDAGDSDDQFTAAVDVILTF